MVDVVLTSALFNNVKMAEPLGLSYLAASLRKAGFRVRIVEPCVEGWSIPRTVAELMKIPCRVIGLSLHRDKNVPALQEFLGLLKQHNIDSLLCVGGHGPSVAVPLGLPAYKELARMVDCFVIGEAEISFERLVSNAISGHDWRNVPGVAILAEDGSFRINPPPPKISGINDIPLMARDVLEQLIGKYGHNVPASIVGSRGCGHNRCKFCTVVAYESLQDGPCYRYRSPQNVVDEIEYLHCKYGISEFNFEDDNFIPPGKAGIAHIEEFCELVDQLEFPISFTFFCRPDVVEHKLFARLRESGLGGLYLGIESVNDAALRFFAKGLSKCKIFAALNTLDELGYSPKIGSGHRVMVGYILWHPLTTLHELNESLRFILDYGLPPKLLRRRFRLYTGAALQEELDVMGLLAPESKRGWRYQVSWMDRLEELTCDFIDHLNNTRDRVRTVEKAIIRFETGYELKRCMEQYRKTLDQACFVYFKGVLDIVEDNNWTPQSSAVLEDYDRAMRTQLAAYVKDNGIEEKVLDGLRILKLPEHSLDAFRK